MHLQKNISGRAAFAALAQTVLFCSAAMLLVLLKAPWPAVGGILTLGVCAIWAMIAGAVSRGLCLAAFSASFLAWCGFVARFNQLRTGTDYCIAALLATLGLLVACQQLGPQVHQRGLRGLTAIWALAASGVFVRLCYLKNQFYEFHLALAGLAATLAAIRLLIRLPGLAIQALHTLILLVIAAPLADWAARPSYQMEPRLDANQRYYSFEAARKDPAAFASWWEYFQKQWLNLHGAISMKNPGGGARYKLRPDSEGRIFESVIRINNLGFRGPDMETAKKDAYRIVAIGESTTFGCTLAAEDRPWPEILEQLFAERIKSARPIQVINAGVYGYTLKDNTARLASQILPLQPDMILSYHGYNFFSALNAAIPPPTGEPPPAFTPRPLMLLAKLEYRIKLAAYQRDRAAEPAPGEEAEALAEPMDSKYAEAYENLIRFTEKHDIRLALANFSMAVNESSPADVIEFYRGGFPEARAEIEANRIHSGIISELARRHPQILPVDTHPRLDGQSAKFIDLVHFTQEGRNDMAEIFYQGIATKVAEDLEENPLSKPVLAR